MNTRALRRLLGLGGVMGMCLVWVPGVAWGQEGRFFMNVEAGPARTMDADFRQLLPGLTPEVRGSAMEFDTGIHFGIGGGYYFTDWLAMEFETGFYGNSIKGFKGAPEVRVHDSSFGQVPLMVNAIFEVPTRSRVVPFAGAGLGGAVSYLYADYMEDDLGPFLDGETSDAVFAYQLFAGVRYSLNDRMFLGLSYRYFSAEGPEWDVDGVFGRDTIELDRVQTHSVNFSFSMRF